jgi:PPK2 family polyphosphate:nucleotide phosphotransferase
MNINYFKIKPNSKIDLSKISTSYTGSYKSKEEAKKKLDRNIEIMTELQQKLYAGDRYALLIIFQAMDAAGKDGTIRHVMSGLNPQGTQVFSFKQPSDDELDHGFLWRIQKCVPERGRIGIFNRSHYEEVLIVRVHNLVKNEKIPGEFLGNNLWKIRYKQINDFEKYLYENGTVILKFFLHVSKEEQKERFIKRIDNPSKNWKFAENDVAERKFWNDYQTAYQEAIFATSTKHAPWYIIPADKKWFMRLAVSEIITNTMKKLNLNYPQLQAEQKEKLLVLKKKLDEE